MHRRGWGSFYAALDRGQIDAAQALRDLLARHPLAGGDPPVYAVDVVSVWPRLDAQCSPERGFYYHPSRHSAGQPIVAGLAYQFIGTSTFSLGNAYVRRFELEHTFRFLKQTLGWSAPRVRHPGQADRWTWLVLAAFAQLGLARAHVAEQRLPWERRYDPGRLTPARVQRALWALLGHLGTPAKPPKPFFREVPRKTQRAPLSGRAKRYLAIKKSA